MKQCVLIRAVLVTALSLFAAVPSVSAFTLTVKPAVTDLSMNPGQSWSGSVRLENPSENPLTVRFDSLNVVPGEESGSAPVPLTGESGADREISLAGWIRVPSRPITIAPRSSANVPVSVSIPAFAAPGDHRAVILFRHEGAEQSGQVAITPVLTAGILVRVGGQAGHDVRLVRFGSGKFFSTSFPVSVGYRIENVGTTLAIVDGYVSVRPVFGGRGVSEPVTGEKASRYVAPTLAIDRTLEIRDDQVAKRGLYRASISVIQGGQTIEKTAYFVVLPLPVAFALLAALVLLIFGSRTAVRLARR